MSAIHDMPDGIMLIMFIHRFALDSGRQDYGSDGSLAAQESHGH